MWFGNALWVLLQVESPIVAGPATVTAVMSSAASERRLRLRGGEDGAQWVVEAARRDGRDRLRVGGQVHGGGRWTFGSQSFLAPAAGPGWSTTLGVREVRRAPVAGTATGESGVSWAGRRGAWRGVAAWGRTESGEPRGRLEVERGPLTVGALRLAEGGRWVLGVIPDRRGAPFSAELQGDAQDQRILAAAGGGAVPVGALIEGRRGRGGTGWRARGALRSGDGAVSATAEGETSAGSLARDARGEVGVAVRAGAWRLRAEGRTGIGDAERGRLEVSAPAGGHRWDLGADVAFRRIDALDLGGAGRGWHFRLRIPSGESTRLTASVVRGLGAGRLRVFAEQGRDAAIGAEWTVSLRPIDELAPPGNDALHGGMP